MNTCVALVLVSILAFFWDFVFLGFCKYMCVLFCFVFGFVFVFGRVLVVYILGFTVV